KRTTVQYSGGIDYPEPFQLNYTGLTPKTPYYYCAFATNSNGTAYGEVKQFTTLDDQGITEEINKIIPKEIQEEMMELGLPIYGGGSPPTLSGTYKISPNILKKSNFQDGHSVGHKFYDLYITFSEQNNADLTIKVITEQYGIIGQGSGAYIVGEGDKFTVFVELINYENGKFHSTTVEIYSGTMTSSGIKNLHYALVMIDDNGDPNDNLIEIGNGRLFYDSDGSSEKVGSTTKSASSNAGLFPLNISSKKQ
ncbi:MAG: hypothetical protein LBS79_10710, partial [Tannerella sp.]|nr:hypothetical protein [Tannerella sp.]